MGIQGLLPLLKSIQKPVSIGADFRGQVLGIDVYCWLHKGAYGCAMELVEGKKSNVYVNYVLKRVEMLLHFDVKPILVFDGSNLPSKAGQEAQRRKTRQDNKAKGLAFLRAGNRQQALESFQKCVDITPDMALEVIKECRKKGVDYIVAPYEADAQLAYLMKSGITQAIISEDSDLLVYGCQKVIFKMDACGHGIAVDLTDLSKLTNLKLHEFSHEKFRHMCILSGCDYLPSVKGVGLHKAIKLLRKSSCVYKLIRSLRLDGKMQVPADYEKNFKQADETYLYQLVFDPVTWSLVPLNQLPEEIKPGDLDFAGPLMSGEMALGIALGNINPISGEVMANFNPIKSPVFTNGVVSEVSVDDNSRASALTPNSLSSWGYPVISKRGKTGYDVQKNLSGLMFDSQPSAKSRRAFVPPSQRKKINEDILDDDSLTTMYTSLKTRPTLIQRNTKALPGRGNRSRFKNPFRIDDQEMESQGEASRYFNLVGSPESPSKLISNGTVESDERSPKEQLDVGEGEDAIMQDVAGFARGAADLTDDQNKENEPRICDSVVEKVEYLSNRRDEAREPFSHTTQTMTQSSGEVTNSHGLLANHPINIDDTKQSNQPYINLCDRFGYNPLLKSSRESTKPNESGLKDIDSGYLSDAENNTDSGTPCSTPTSSCFTRLTPPSSDENVARLLSRGSAAGTKTMKNQIQLKSKTGVRSSGLGRCRAMGITRKKSKQTSSRESFNSGGSSTLFSYFEFERRKRPRLEEDQSESSKLSQ